MRSAGGLRAVFLWLLFPLLGIIVAALVFPAAMAESKRPHDYVFLKRTASNGVKLYALATRPDNIALTAIDRNVTHTGLYGINGGFFYNGDLLSIAVMNDRPAKGEPHDYGTGWYNTDLPRGTLVWDAARRAFSIQLAKHASELEVADRGRYWAQGGVSMSLDRSAPGEWERQMIAEQMPAYDEERLRSGAVYDRNGQVWLLVSATPCTAGQFRSAIREKIAPGLLVDGIFLDGDGSSQLASAQASLEGDGREVYQMLRIVR